MTNGTGQATINSSGLVSALSDGTVTARATATDGSGIFGTLVITIASQLIPVTSIIVTGAGGAMTISSNNGTLQLSAEALPANATDRTVSWSVANGTGEATINSAGIVTAIANGTVTAKATANDGTGIFGTLVITISNQIVLVSGISVTGEDGARIITGNGATLQLSALVLPSNATNKTITWSIENGTGEADMDASGLVTAIANGTVTARATSNDGSGVSGTLVITISGQIVPVSEISVAGEGDKTTITSGNESLQLNAEVLPVNATDRSVSWSVVNATGAATISSEGLVTAVTNGTVTAQAMANDGSGVYGSLDISINIYNQKSYSVIVTADEIIIIFYEDFVSSIADLFNLQGNHVARKIVDTNTVIFNSSQFASGLYILVIRSREILLVEKIMVP